MEIATRGWDAKVEKVKQDESARKSLTKEYQKLFEDQVDLDLAYLRSRSVWLDLKIMAWTVPTVLMRKGAD